jgi:hypothetical protein
LQEELKLLKLREMWKVEGLLEQRGFHSLQMGLVLQPVVEYWILGLEQQGQRVKLLVQGLLLGPLERMERV